MEEPTTPKTTETASDQPQGLLYHYTTQEGLQGILTCKKIWATHIRYLNDLQEFKTGLDLIERVVAKTFSEKKDRRLGHILERIGDCDFYVASFSHAHKGDALSLWRAYGKSLPGYSLGFSQSKLREVIRPRSDGIYSAMSWLSKVSYVSKEQDLNISLANEYRETPTVDSIISYLRSNYACNSVVGNTGLEEWISAVRNELEAVKQVGLLLTSVLPSLKDSSFLDEMESRIIVVRPPNSSNPVRFHSGTWSIVPHVEVPISFGAEAPPIIERIVVGPCPHPIEAKKAVEMLLASLKIAGVQVDSSEIPYRNW